VGLVLPQAWTVVLDVALWGLFHTLTGYAAHRLGDARLSRPGRLLRLRRFEQGGGWYRRHVRIHRWKDRVPEAGDLFRGGMTKRELPALDDAGLARFVLETRRAELAHWWAMACGPLFVLFNPPLAAGVLVGYGVAVNAPFIAIQRYNRARLVSVQARRARRTGPAT
jgi:glycosyl-4,4'-diaponeurosporenoate acyltransferase